MWFYIHVGLVISRGDVVCVCLMSDLLIFVLVEK